MGSSPEDVLKTVLYREGTGFEARYLVHHLNYPSKLLAISAVVTVVASMGSAADTQPPVNARFKGFIARANQYLAQQKKLEKELKLPPLKPTDQPTRVEVHERGLAEGIRTARLNAKPGDIFGDAADELKRVIKEDAKTRSVRDAYAAMQEVPVQNPPHVNAEYPERAPLATVPPLILKRLPVLPDGLEYRFMGRDLILRDAKANLIIDYIQDAVPTVQR